MRAAFLVLVPPIALGLAGATVTAVAREADSAFVAQQRAGRAPTGTQLERLIATTREPLPGGSGRRAVRARCDAAPSRGWRCVVRYASGRTIAYSVSISGRGSFRGRDRSGDRAIEGCCVTR